MPEERDWPAFTDALIRRNKAEQRVKDLESFERSNFRWISAACIFYVAGTLAFFIAKGSNAALLFAIAGFVAGVMAFERMEVRVSVLDKVNLGDGVLDISFSVTALRNAVVPPLFHSQVSEAARSYLRRCEIAGTTYKNMVNVDREIENEIKTKLNLNATVTILSVNFARPPKEEPPPPPEDVEALWQKTLDEEIEKLARDSLRVGYVDSKLAPIKQKLTEVFPDWSRTKGFSARFDERVRKLKELAIKGP